MFTENDKIAKLQRLEKQVDMWNLQVKILPVAEVGKPGLFIGSPEFKEWQGKVVSAITLIFGEHSRYIDDFNEIPYTNFLAHYLPGGPQTAVLEGLATAKRMLQTMIDEIKVPEGASQDTVSSPPIEHSASAKESVFIGHGRSPLWAKLQIFLEKELGLTTLNYESESRAGESIVSILENMLDQSGFAVLVLTAEDETSLGNRRARQNVIHEAGLFQGKLGFRKAILLVQEGLEDFSNVAGLQHISFSGNRIDQTFYELQRVLKREGLISRSVA